MKKISKMLDLKRQLAAASSDRDDARQAVVRLTEILTDLHSQIGGATEVIRFSAEMHLARGDELHGSRSKDVVRTLEDVSYKIAKLAFGNGGIDRLIIDLADPERPF